jgi:prepilin-type N-terminal cleavage/methylation domain-containing protein
LTGVLNTEDRDWRRGFTLVELLVVFAIIGILAAILLPVLTRPNSTARRTVCLNNVRQIDVATRLYADEHGDAVVLPAGLAAYITPWAYKSSVKSYLSLAGTNSPSEKIFACPADTYCYLDRDLSGGPPWKGFRVNKGLCQQAWTGFCSYSFNDANRFSLSQFPSITYPGIANMPLTAIKNPARTLLVLESAARLPWSWHREGRGFDDSMNVLGFVDGHAKYSKMYWNGSLAACDYDPPDGYDYKWSGN